VSTCSDSEVAAAAAGAAIEAAAAGAVDSLKLQAAVSVRGLVAAFLSFQAQHQIEVCPGC